MPPPAVVEQQTKLGVSAEESKVERLKRQQARFRDRGGAFVPSTSNPLVDILLARTVSGESPSKARLKHVTAKRPSPVKARRTSTRKSITTSEESRAVAGSGGPSAPKKRKKNAPELEDDTTKSLRGVKQAKGRKKVPDTDLGTEQPPPKSKSSPNRKKQHDTNIAPSTSSNNVKPKPKSRTKSNPAKAVVEVPVSDDEGVRVETRPVMKSNIRRDLQNGDGGETNAKSLNPGRVASPAMDDIQTSDAKNTVCIKEENVAGKASSRKKAQDTVNGKGKGRVNPNQHTSELVEDDERPPGRSSKPRKRKKEENHDDRPRKVVKFSGTGPPNLSSRDLKENQTVTKSRMKNVSDAPRLKLTAKPPSRTKRLKGPPREVLERIKASVGRHLHCADSDLDELDCLS